MQVIQKYFVFYVNKKLREIDVFSLGWSGSFRQTVD